MDAKTAYSGQDRREHIRKDSAMFEVAMTAEAREGIRRAHQERARAVKSAFSWLFPSRSAR
jgi:hypothetical protein